MYVCMYVCLKNYISESVRSVAAVVLENYSSVCCELLLQRDTVKRINRSIETSCQRKLDHLNGRICIYIDELALQRKLSMVILTEVMGICLGSTNFSKWAILHILLDRCRNRRFIAEQYVYNLLIL